MTLRWLLTGRVQGVGFRPFVYRLAREHGIHGWVRNRSGQVEILGQGRTDRLDRFERALTDAAPPTAAPHIAEREVLAWQQLEDFRIETSQAGDRPWIQVPPDHFACPDCLAEVRDPTDRRYRYPFNNCTQCGPRYTLIRALPYDRPNTTLSGFVMCPACATEYRDPGDRRFHAEPIACPDCGPWLSYRPDTAPAPAAEGEAAVEAAAAALRAGEILAVKGIGGYHLMCAADNTDAIERLRARKPRPHKPLAVLFPDEVSLLRREVNCSEAELACLRSAQRPILLLPRTPAPSLPESLAPGLGELGVMLPCSPLHALLLQAAGGPLVATSGNLSGEPVLTDNAEADARLSDVVDGFLHHNRPIQRPADDSVLRPIAGAVRPLRLGRGSAPLELELETGVPEPLLAVGAHMKNTLALAWDRRLIVSPHIGDMGSRRSLEVFRQLVEDFQALHGVRATRLLCDAHPDYTTHRWARESGLPVTPVFHHHAHASALCGEHGIDEPCLIFTWDGTGYGADGGLWGGEALYGRPGHWRHLARLRPFRLPGGDRAGREPWRAAAALCWENGLDYTPPVTEPSLLRAAWQRGLNSPATSAAGRLFDAAASLIGLLQTASYEGQGPMLLEQAAAGCAGEALVLPLLTEAPPWQLDWTPLLAHLRDGRLPVAQRAADFHASLAGAIRDTARRTAADHAFTRVGLTGGVFQNRLLTELAQSRLQAAGFEVLLCRQLPCNDAGISAGQVYEHLGGQRGED
ncbi:carbamoyltransferase HypF [Thiohalobacter thiocyanaticus]|uniref:Carbamoyltransferase HypF n=1 Tax=Thiohalobacter thiocyanaticus TaxID=585455 RepID=A0A426QM79_9GAMM|nr:carbamoyltransferase HypF [Thiohalobacter thiocyanaticus]RRQ22871.1 carbamoyltransferase HypF [Thiohalobacter thiocyanaticus]